MKMILCILLVAALVIGVWAGSAALTLWVWNTLAGYFGSKTITFWIAALINLALGLISSSFRSRKS